MPKRPAKPFTVWPCDRERPYRYATYAEAEAYARKSLQRLARDGITPAGGVAVERDGIGNVLAVLKLNVDGRVVIDMTVEGTAYA